MACCDYTGLIRFVYDWQTYIAGLLALGGGFLAYRAGIKQARATHQAAEQSTRSMQERSQLVERAYISGGGVRATEPFDISATGIGLITPHPVRPGTVLVLRLASRTRGVSRPIVVRAMHATAQDGGGWLIGAVFVRRLSAEALRELQSDGPPA